MHFFKSTYLTKTVKNLIIINILIFVLSSLFRIINWYIYFGLVPAKIINQLNIWQFFTYMFFHADVFHILINMLMLWFLGCGLEKIWGGRKFLLYYIITGIGAGICSFLTSINSFIPVIGASGAVFGLLVAYALFFPDTVVYVFFIFPMKIKYVVYIFGGINLLAALSNPGSQIAYMAHIGGGLTGYLLIKTTDIFDPFKKNISTFSILERVKNNFYEKTKKKQEKKQKSQENTLDLLLDKVSKKGMDSLSNKEKKILHKISKSRK